jgi:hypothetical protein
MSSDLAYEKETFLIITDAGSAAAHRGFAPDVPTFHAVLTAAEAFLYREFIMPKAAEAVRNATPARNPRKTGP